VLEQAGYTLTGRKAGSNRLGKAALAARGCANRHIHGNTAVEGKTKSMGFNADFRRWEQLLRLSSGDGTLPATLPVSVDAASLLSASSPRWLPHRSFAHKNYCIAARMNFKLNGVGTHADLFLSMIASRHSMFPLWMIGKKAKPQ
jgi:hypothetical protein